MSSEVVEFLKTLKEKITIYTDGACSKNPGPGGWGAVFVDSDIHIACNGFEEKTTNNRMEMMAAIEALYIVFKNTPNLCVDLYTDSQYLKDGITSWIKKWRTNNWLTSAGAPVKNQDLWMKLDELTQKLKINWHWVKGHDGNQYNEIADTFARNAIIGGVIKR
jgi:ribonuclease HI